MSVGVFINVLTVVVWLAWAQFTACVLVEVKAALSGVGLPARVPGAGPNQLLARQLVTARAAITRAEASLEDLPLSELMKRHQPTVERRV